MTAPWSKATWHAEVKAWVVEKLAASGIEPRGSLEDFRVRPWAAILRIATAQGYVYFKALPPGREYEVGLTAHLSNRFPKRFLPMPGVDVQRGSMLTPDGGKPLHNSITPELAQKVWPLLLTDYAQLQIDEIDQSDKLLELGVPDRRLKRTAAMFDEATAQLKDFLGVANFSGDEARQFANLRPWVLESTAQLGALGLPDTLQHDDLHARNVLMKNGRAVVFDWGDACVSHPFFTLRETLISIAECLSVEYLDDPPELNAFRNAYLNPWLRLAQPSDLLEASRLAETLSILPRILSWELAVASVSPQERAETADFVVKLFRELIQRWLKSGL